jgi:hypothetical protein
MKANTKIMKIVVVGLFTSFLVACAHEGTLITFGSGSTSILRASDQSVLADAIDKAFDGLDANGLKTNLREVKAETAYLIIAAPFALAQSTLDYIQLKAALLTGQIGIRVLEVIKTVERITPERTWEVLQEEYPDTDARVIVAVSYAGVDEMTTEEQQVTHGSKKPDRIFKGRFKAAFGITPRKAAFTAVVQKIEGESEYEVTQDKYVDDR